LICTKLLSNRTISLFEAKGSSHAELRAAEERRPDDRLELLAPQDEASEAAIFGPTQSQRGFVNVPHRHDHQNCRVEGGRSVRVESFVRMIYLGLNFLDR